MPFLKGGDVRRRAGCTVYGAKNGISPAGGEEALLQMRRGNRESVAGLVASDAASAVCAHGQEKWIGGSVGRAAGDHIGDGAARVPENLKFRYDHIAGIAEREARRDRDKCRQHGSYAERPTDNLMPRRRWPGRVNFLGCERAGAGWHKGSFRAECHHV